MNPIQPIDADARTQLTRRELLGFAAKGAASVVVSQALLARGDAVSSQQITMPADSTIITDPTTVACVQTAALTEGPFFVDEKLNRSDIRSDPATGVVSAGALLNLKFNVMRVSSGACTPLTGAYLDVWHCDSAGTYSDVSGAGNGAGGAGRKFLRGYQVTDANGVAQFTTVYPGWYRGRAVHVHFKLRLFAGSSATYEFTSQFFFDEALTDAVHAQSPYNSKGRRNVVNISDGIYNSLSAEEKSALTLRTSPAGSAYTGEITLGVRVG
ncbi:MAG: twin-arginine translocation pathway signal protein [Gemmatimonadota bacterium]